VDLLNTELKARPTYVEGRSDECLHASLADQTPLVSDECLHAPLVDQTLELAGSDPCVAGLLSVKW
jgi:hypothetical protein